MAFLQSCDTEETFDLPRGETTVGRGPYLKVIESKVSRKHAILLHNETGIFIKPIHKNPTFLFVESTNTWDALERDVWHNLKHCSRFSLLPQSLRYKVCKEDDKEIAKRISEDKEPKKETQGIGRRSITEIEETSRVQTEINETTETFQKAKQGKNTNLNQTSGEQLSTDNGVSRTALMEKKSNEKDTSNKSKTQEIHELSKEIDKPGTSRLNEQRRLSADIQKISFGKNNTKKKVERQLPAWMVCVDETQVKKKTASRKKEPKAQKKQTSKQQTSSENQNTNITNSYDDPDDSLEPKNRPRTKTDSKLSGQEPSAVDKRSTKACKSPQQKDFSSRKTSEVSSSKTERSFSEYKVNTSTSSFSRDKHSSLGAQVPVDNTSYDILGDLMGFTPKNVSSNIPKESSYSKKESPKRELPSPGVEDNSSSVLSQLMDTTKQSEQSNNKKRKLEDSPEKEISPPKKKVLSDDESCRASDTLPKKNPSSTFASSSDVLPRCPYGKQCYRNNPVHFQQYSHGGNKNDDDEDDDRPECQYGTSCYRANPDHKKMFKHTQDISQNMQTQRKRQRPQRKTKGKSVLEGDSDDDGDANTYDYDDSFIEDDEGDDESYEDSEDEDFVPSDDGDDGGEEKEDISDLVSEAKDFIDG